LIIFDQYILSVLRFNDWIITLPVDLEDKIIDAVEKMEGKPMAYVTSFERVWEKRIKKDVVINMINKNYPIEEISDITGLPIDEIKKLKVPQKV